MSAREISIGLLWHSAGAGNLGIGALTVGNLALARDAARAVGLTPKFTILHFPSDMDESHIAGDDVRVFRINGKAMVNPSGYWAEIGKLDCILDIGAGDSFTDIYDAKRFAYLWVTKELAYLRGKPLVMSPQTIGPFSRQPYVALASHAMRKAFAVVARDPQSMTAIGELAPTARRVQAVDVAFRLPFDKPAPRSGEVLEVGVNVSGLLFNGGYGGSNEYGLDVDYADLMRRFIAEQVARPNVRVHLVPHVFSERLPVDDDGRVADLLAKEFPQAVRAPDFVSPSAAKSYIAGLDFLVAGRMHACIAAFSAGVPVVPVAYSRKFSGLFGGVLNYPHQIPVKGLSTDEALEFLRGRLADREALKQSIAEGLKVVEPALAAYDEVLRDLFQNVAARKR
ncbi:MAG: polysaccharide pyruvyl transferase family protein [Pseudomonadota bacterium]